MYIRVCNYIILVIITIDIGEEAFVKKFALIVLTLVLCFAVSSCVRSGETDSIDFFSEMHRRGYKCTVDEVMSGDMLKESCYVDNFKLSVFSGGDGQLKRVSVTYSGYDSSGFGSIAADVICSFCGFDTDQANLVLSSLGVSSNLPSDSSGVKRCDTQWYGFSFTCDKTGGTLVVENYRLSPTSAPEVTLNTTVPFVTFGSSEKSSS